MIESHPRVTRFGSGLLSLLLALAVSGPVRAQIVDLGRMASGYTYFNRPGADLEQHNADMGYCLVQAGLTSAGSNFSFQGGFVGAALESTATRHVVPVNIENCMIVLGWRLMVLPDDQGQALAGLGSAELSARLAPMVGLREPPGSLARSWANDATRASNPRFTQWPRPNAAGQLSIKVLPIEALRPGSSQQSRIERLKLDPRWPAAALKLKDIPSAPPEAAILLVRLRGENTRTGMNMSFGRLGPDPGVRPAATDRQPDLVTAALGLLFIKDEGDFFAFAVPAGRWRINDMNNGMLTFCLGAPSFEVKAGEVVYAGTFDFKAESFAPNMDLEPAKGFLAGLPDSAAKLRAAEYTNGSLDSCAGGELIYALEIEGAPYAPDYRWGGAAAAPIP